MKRCAPLLCLALLGCDRITGTKPRAACLTRSYHDTIYITFDSSPPPPQHITIGSCPR